MAMGNFDVLRCRAGFYRWTAITRTGSRGISRTRYAMIIGYSLSWRCVAIAPHVHCKTEGGRGGKLWQDASSICNRMQVPMSSDNPFPGFLTGWKSRRVPGRRIYLFWFPNGILQTDLHDEYFETHEQRNQEMHPSGWRFHEWNVLFTIDNGTLDGNHRRMADWEKELFY